MHAITPPRPLAQSFVALILTVCAVLCLSTVLVATLPAAAHVDLTVLRSSSTKLRRHGWGGISLAAAVNRKTSLKWQELLTHLRHIKKTNPRRVVRRLTFNGDEKLGSMSNLSSATAGLLTHIDFSRSRREIDFEQLGANLPGLRGLGVRPWILKCRSAQPP